ncbi:MAG: hypothetical protein MK200_08685, partial [Nitrosopumilus sp.]|nr:hypothetical protein [Nitrosopumilus sp.]
MTQLKEGLIGGGLNLYFIYKFLRILTTPWEKSEAFKLGIVDDNGKILKKKRTLKTVEEKEAYTMMHRLVWKLKRLMEKVPFGKSRLASYAAALWLIKEHKFQGTDEQLQESFLTFLETDWKNDALILKEKNEGDMDKKTFSKFLSEIKIDEKWEVGVVYHQEFSNGDRTYFRADSVQKNKRWKGMQVDEFGGKQKKAKNATADEKVQGWETTPKNEIPKALKEEVEEAKSHTGYELYHKTFSGAMQHAYKFAKSKGHIVDPKEIDDKVATGPKKPS